MASRPARRNFSAALTLWGAPRIHGELLKLGIDIGEGGLFKSPNLEGYTTAMNVSQREGLGADGIMMIKCPDTFCGSSR
jgi:hypothetical protein